MLINGSVANALVNLVPLQEEAIMEDERDATDVNSEDEEEVEVIPPIIFKPLEPDPPIEVAKNYNQTEEKEVDVKWLNSKKMKPVNTKSTQNLEISLPGYIKFLNSHFGSIFNLLKMLYNTEESKKDIEKFVKVVGAPLPKELEEKIVSISLSNFCSILNTHLKKISILIRSLPKMTDDLYNAIRDLLAFGGTTQLLRFSEIHTIGRLLNATTLRNIKKSHIIAIKSMEEFVPEIHRKVKVEKKEIELLLPPLFEREIIIDVDRKYLNVYHELWMHFAVITYQVDQMGGFMVDNGTLKLGCGAALDGSVLKDVGKQILVGFARVIKSQN